MQMLSRLQLRQREQSRYFVRAFIPTPTISYIGIGPLKFHLYALCILLGILIASGVAIKRLPEKSELITDLVIFAVPAGIVGARIFHVLTTPEKYFNSNFLDAFKIWEGGLGIWGAILGGAIAIYIVLRLRGETKEFFPLADALAPGLLFAQAIGRFGNWFNGELFGGPSSLPWALQVPLGKRPLEYIDYETFHPTFLYEAMWCTLVGLFLITRKNWKTGQVFWGYVSLYSLGRIFIETIRIDFSNLIFGIRLNIWTALIFLTLGVWQYLKISRSKVG